MQLTRSAGDRWLSRVALILTASLGASGLAALAHGEGEGFPVVGPVVVAAVTFLTLGWFGRRRPRLARAGALIVSGVVLISAALLLFGPGFGPIAALGVPFVVLAAGGLGSTAAFVTADLLVLGWAVGLGLVSGGFWPGVVELPPHDAASFLHLSALAAVLNSAALACVWLRKDADLRATCDLERLRQKCALLESEVEAVQPMASVGRLVAAVAHEVSNPVQAMDHIAFVLIEETPEEDPRRSKLITLKQALGQLAQYLDQLSEFYRPFADTGPADLNQILADVFRFLERQLENANVKVSQELETELPAARMGEDPLRQVVLNVVLNAVEAMSQGGKLEVATGVEGDHVFAAFQDSGPGIPEPAAEHIFESFFTTKSDRGGTGLGLAIAQRLLRRHGGELVAESRSGRGAQFILRVPVASPERESR